MSDFAKRLDAARFAVAEACHVCRKVQERLASVRSMLKDDKSPVTVADFASQAVVARTLAERLGSVNLVAEEDADRFRDHFARARRAGSRMDHEIRVRRADGSTCTMLARIAPTREGESGEVAWVGTPIDLTARRAAERARQSAAVERALAQEPVALDEARRDEVGAAMSQLTVRVATAWASAVASRARR